MTALHPLVARLSPSEQQRPAITARGHDIVVTAGAGTGKTRTLVARALSLMADGMPLRQIVAVTFTRKAAREMRNRLRRELSAYLQEKSLSAEDREGWQAQVDALDAARIGTIHQLCADILRAHPAEAGVDPRFAVLEESAAILFKQEAVDAAMAWAAEDAEGAALFAFLGERNLRRVLGQLLADRLGATESLSAMATADPEAILSRWADLLARQQADALEKLTACGAWRTAVAALRDTSPTEPTDRMAAQRAAVLAALAAAAGAETIAAGIAALAPLHGINLSGGRAAAWPAGKAQLDEVKGALRTLRELWRGDPILKLSLNAADRALAGALPGLAAAFTLAREQYRAARERLQALDFDDLEAQALALLESHEPVRRYWQTDVVGALLVDEFQDTNERQRRLARLLAGDTGKLFIVGDAKQSIYRFRGADVVVFRQEREAIRHRGGQAHVLDVCYRAHPDLIQAMNDLLRSVLGGEAEATEPWQEPFAPLAPPEEDARPARGAAPFVELHLTAGSKADGSLERAAAAIAARLLSLEEAGIITDFGEVAILCRASTSFSPYEDALDAAGIPYLTVAGRGFYGRPEIRDTLNALAAIADPSDDLALAGLLRSPGLGLSDHALFRLARARPAGQSLWQALKATPECMGSEVDRARRAVKLIEDWHRLAGRAPVADVLKRYLDETHARAALRQTGQTRAARNLAKLVADAHGSGLVSVDAFLLYVTGLRDAGAREGEARATGDGAAQIMTIHAAKGLEFPVVVLGDAAYEPPARHGLLLDSELGVLLSQKDEEGERAGSYGLGYVREVSQEKAEHNRLLYVACTRAEQRLLISGHASRVRDDTTLSTGGWLKQLAAALGLDGMAFPDYREDGGRAHHFTCQVGRSAVAGSLLESGYDPGQPAPVRSTPPAAAVATLPSSLLEPLPAAARPDEDPERVWQVIPTSPRAQAPAWLVGTLVHEALAAWRFRDSSSPEKVIARCRHYGLSDAQRIQDAGRKVEQLLGRFQAHPLFREMDQAERRLHEVPFSMPGDGGSVQGKIDCLYRHAGQWTIVDFKTDRVARREDLASHSRQAEYEEQIRSYRAAVTSFQGEQPRTLLCWLDVAGEIVVTPIEDHEA